VVLDRGAAYGNTLSWPLSDPGHPSTQAIKIQFDLDTQKFYRMFVALMTASTPH
jgi:hypothetical protein